ncbi:DUF4011 domain-containing protein [Proteinivorax hydrogeniformans]|uniref:DUF4011 domain-containing protein n=1 Tax=Proteinivorax hydrogeniformans TaxID=1826727 RepID=A0AAU8HUD8_9FIRM
MNNMDLKLETWKKKLLDLGKRNRLINYRETKRSNLNIVTPQYDELYNRIVEKEDTLVFPYPTEREANDDSDKTNIEVIEGDLKTDRTIQELQKTLKSIRYKAKTAMEEQGVNILYLSFGFLSWKESIDSSQDITSPIVLVPVSLTVESITDPYKLSIHEDEIVVNPTLSHKLNNDFGIHLPEFDAQHDGIIKYLDEISQLAQKNGWKVEGKVSLSLLSFLKINMYHDLSNYEDKLKNHGVVKALCGDSTEIEYDIDEMAEYDHDTKDKPVDIYQVVDADSSQQDAIVLSKKGVSFVLQGPPGTGKSQTITNIIAEALADGKKVLFVSEKMAALDVVHRRLTEVGLDDFCLTLHSHKANKREVLHSLSKALKKDKVSVREDAIYNLDVLKNVREQLNEYSTQLHTPCEPLGLSIYQVNGILAKLNFAPDVIFSLNSVEQTTKEKLYKYVQLLNNFTRTMEKMGEDYKSNPWKGCGVNQVSHDLRQNIHVILKELLYQANEIGKNLTDMLEKLSLKSNNLNFLTMDVYEELLSFCAKSSQVPKQWLISDDIEELINDASDFDNKQKNYLKLEEDISSVYAKGIYDLDGRQISDTLDNCFEEALSILDNHKYKSESEIYESINKLLSICEVSRQDMNKLSSSACVLSGKLKLDEPKNIGETKKLYNFFKSFNKRIMPSLSWFDNDNTNSRNKLLEQAQKTQCDIESLEADILKLYEKDALNIEYASMLWRFKTEYTSVLKFFKKAYRQDRKAIRGLRITPVKKVHDNEVLELLNKLKTLHEKKNWLKEKDSELRDKLGGLYDGQDTNYTEIEDAFVAFEAVNKYFKGVIPEGIKQNLLSGNNFKMCSDILSEIQSIWDSGNINDYKDLLSDKGLELVRYTSLIQRNKELANLLRICKEEILGVAAFSKGERSCNEHRNSIENLARLQEIKENIITQRDLLVEKYQFLYKGLDTDWQQIQESLLWSSKFKEYIKKYNLPEAFQDKIISGSYSQEAKNCAEYIRISKEQINSNIKWFSELFESENEIKKLNFFALQDKLEKCLENLAALEEWIDFRKAREDCEEEGLSDFIDAVQEEKVSRELIVDTFKKRFYKLWLDAILPQFQAVQSFRKRNHLTTIEQFVKLDKLQMDIAKARIKENLIAKLPNVNSVTAAFDEVSILKRELEKRKRIMPIRKLFSRIPTLLPSLKPCLMMSPLSVSLFLQSHSYDFDMVIFDEASQVCTENAVGAIMRGKQVVIAGDSKQLPPTNFFNASISGEDLIQKMKNLMKIILAMSLF